MSASKKNNAILKATSLTACLLAMPAAEAAWIIQPSAQVATTWEDNVRLDQFEQDGFVTRARVQGRFANVTEVSSFSAVAGISYLMYSGFDDDDAPGSTPLDDEDEEFLTLSAQRRTERATFGLRADLRSDILLRRVDEIPDDVVFGADPAASEDPGAVEAPVAPETDLAEGATDSDTSTVREQVRRNRFVVNPSLRYDLTERTSAQLGYTFYGLRYDSEGEDAGLRDSDSHGVNGQLRRRVSQRDSVDLNARYFYFDPDDVPGQTFDPQSDTYEATLGWNRRVTERFRFSVELGGSRVESDAGDDNGFTYRASADLSTEQGRITGAISRTNIPSAWGDVAETDRASVSYLHRLSERLSFNIAANAYRTDREDRSGSDANRDREYFSVSPGMSWRMTEEIALGLNYAYRWIDRKNEPDSSSGNSVSLSLTYAPQRRF